MRKISADYLYCNGKSLIKDGVLFVDSKGTILDIIDPSKHSEDISLEDVEKMNGILCPGFINTHCHTELSIYKNLIPQKNGLDGFIRDLEKAKNSNFTPEQIEEAIASADLAMWNNGIVAVGDICNTSQSLAVKRKSSIYYQNFIELFGSNEHHAPALFLKAQKLVSDFEQGGLQATITPHSLYSLSESLLAMIVKHQAQKQELLSIHFMESEEEIEFFAQRTGKIIERLQSFGITPLQFENLRVRPSEIAETALNNDLSTLFVHNTFAENEDVLRIINEFTSPWFCLCPKANLYIENRLPNIELLIKNQVQITVGTDSLASNQTLSILEELTIIQQNYPEINTATLLQWATENGAKFLQIEKKFGLISIGKAPGINLISCENGLLSNAKGVKRVV